MFYSKTKINVYQVILVIVDVRGFGTGTRGCVDVVLGCADEI